MGYFYDSVNFLLTLFLALLLGFFLVVLIHKLDSKGIMTTSSSYQSSFYWLRKNLTIPILTLLFFICINSESKITNIKKDTNNLIIIANDIKKDTSKIIIVTQQIKLDTETIIKNIRSSTTGILGSIGELKVDCEIIKKIEASLAQIKNDRNTLIELDNLSNFKFSVALSNFTSVAIAQTQNTNKILINEAKNTTATIIKEFKSNKAFLFNISDDLYATKILLEDLTKTNKEETKTVKNQLIGVTSEVGSVKNQLIGVTSEVGSVKNQLIAVTSEVESVKIQFSTFNKNLLNSVDQLKNSNNNELVLKVDHMGDQFNALIASTNELSKKINKKVNLMGSQVNKKVDLMSDQINAVTESFNELSKKINDNELEIKQLIKAGVNGYKNLESLVKLLMQMLHIDANVTH